MNILQYINDAVAELHQVRWPTRQQAVRLSVITIGFTLTSAAPFGSVAHVLPVIVKLLLSLTY